MNAGEIIKIATDLANGEPELTARIALAFDGIAARNKALRERADFCLKATREAQDLCGVYVTELLQLREAVQTKEALLLQVIPLLEHVIEDDSPYTVSQSRDMIAALKKNLQVKP